MSVNNHRKCAKCGKTRAEEMSVSYHRFPNPGKKNIAKACAWAKYCWPNKDWTSVESLQSLYTSSKVLCGRHFTSSQFYDNLRQKLSIFAVPDLFELDKSQDEENLLNQMPLLWGIVSAGKISHDFVNAFNSYPAKGDQVIAAVAARDKSRANEFAKSHNISKVFDNYQALATSEDIDVAYIGVLNPQHYEITKLFLENGKHVLCEKPLCLNYKQARSLIDIAKRKKLFLMEAVWSRFSPAYLALEKEINSGKLGDVKFVDVNFGVPIAGVNRLNTKSLGGSAVLDIGVYVLQFAQFIFKEAPTKVTAVGETNEDGVDLVDSIILEYSGGRRAVLNIHAKVKLWNKATVTGTLGRATLEDPFHFPDKLIKANGDVETFTLHTSNVPYNFANSAGLVYQTLEVNRCIKEGLLESPRMTHNDSLILAKLEDAVRQQVGVHYEEDDKEYP